MKRPTLIFTGSWRASIDPDRFALIGISRSAPRGRVGYRKYAALQPGNWFRSIPDAAAWTTRYNDEVLGRLDPEKVVADLAAMAGDQPAVLLCWELPPPNREWCHRALVSQWLHKAMGLEVPELGFEGCGHGSEHPKLPPK